MGMGRPRKHDKHLPPRVYLRHGTYYFADITGRWHPLGRGMADMYRALSALAEPRALTRMADVIDRYRIEILPGKAPKTQADHRRILERLTAVFGRMRPADVRPVDVAAYRDRRAVQRLRTLANGTTRRDGGATAACRELEVLKHVLRHAVMWGAIDDNPAREVGKVKITRRDRYVTDAEYAAVHAVASAMVKIAMDLAVLTGQRRGDLLSLKREQLTEDGVLFSQAKTGKRLIIGWSDELRAVITRAKAMPPHVRQTIICNLQGRPYTGDGFSSMWDRTMTKALAAGLTERFHFHDLRAKSASEDTAEAATARLGHNNAAVTERYYRRLPTTARPLR